MNKNTIFFYALLILLGLSSCSILTSSLPSQRARLHLTPTLQDQHFYQGNPQLVWSQLQGIPPHTLLNASLKPLNDTADAWIKLALISKQNSRDTAELSQALLNWRKLYPSHPANRLLSDSDKLTSLINRPRPKNIIVLLPLEGPFASSGKMVREGFLNAYFESLAKTQRQQTITFVNTYQKDILSLYQHAIEQGAELVVGPLTKENVEELRKGVFSVPIIALNYLEPSSSSLPANLYQFGLSPLDEAKQLADKAIQSGNHRALLIAPRNEWGMRVSKTLIARWQEQGGKIADKYYYSDHANYMQEIAALLHAKPPEESAKEENPQRRQDFDTVFLLASTGEAKMIVPLLRFYAVGRKIPIYATSNIYSDPFSIQGNFELNGVYVCEMPWMLKIYQERSTLSNDPRSNRFFAVGRDAYAISQELPRFSFLPYFPYYGATGAVTLNPTRQFYRRLPWIRIQDGNP